MLSEKQLSPNFVNIDYKYVKKKKRPSNNETKKTVFTFVTWQCEK